MKLLELLVISFNTISATFFGPPRPTRNAAKSLSVRKRLHSIAEDTSRLCRRLTIHDFIERIQRQLGHQLLKSLIKALSHFFQLRKGILLCLKLIAYLERLVDLLGQASISYASTQTRA